MTNRFPLEPYHTNTWMQSQYTVWRASKACSCNASSCASGMVYDIFLPSGADVVSWLSSCTQWGYYLNRVFAYRRRCSDGAGKEHQTWGTRQSIRHSSTKISAENPSQTSDRPYYTKLSQSPVEIRHWGLSSITRLRRCFPCGEFPCTWSRQCLGSDLVKNACRLKIEWNQIQVPKIHGPYQCQQHGTQSSDDLRITCQAS